MAELAARPKTVNGLLGVAYLHAGVGIRGTLNHEHRLLDRAGPTVRVTLAQARGSSALVADRLDAPHVDARIEQEPANDRRDASREVRFEASNEEGNAALREVEHRLMHQVVFLIREINAFIRQAQKLYLVDHDHEPFATQAAEGFYDLHRVSRQDRCVDAHTPNARMES